MKRFLSYVPNWLLEPIFAILLVVAWPLLLIWMGLKTLFDEKMDDPKKIRILKEITITFFFFIGILVLLGIFGDSRYE